MPFNIIERSEWSRGQNYVIVPNFVEIARTAVEISRFLFFKMAAAVILDCKHYKFLTVGHAEMVELLHTVPNFD